MAEITPSAYMEYLLEKKLSVGQPTGAHRGAAALRYLTRTVLRCSGPMRLCEPHTAAPPSLYYRYCIHKWMIQADSDIHSYAYK